MIGSEIKPPAIRDSKLTPSGSEISAQDHRVDLRSFALAVVFPAARDLGETGAAIERQGGLVIGGDLEKCGRCSARGSLLGEALKGDAGAPLAAAVRMGGEGQHLGLVDNDAAKHETGGVTDQKDRWIDKKAAKLIGAPAAGVAEGEGMGGGEGLGGAGHGRITGGASREGAASAART